MNNSSLKIHLITQPTDNIDFYPFLALNFCHVKYFHILYLLVINSISYYLLFLAVGESGVNVSMIETWLSVEQIAHHLGLSKETVYRWLEKGKIPAHRVGKQWRFKPSEVDAWVQSGHAAEDMADLKGEGTC